MFTGIIEEIGKVLSIDRNNNSCKLKIKANKVLEDINLGDSIATNGVCLTVTQIQNDNFTVDVMPQTMKLTNLSYLKINDFVNLERALKLSSRLGGHIVSGHIDCIGVIQIIKSEDNAFIVKIKPNDNSMKYIIDRGSIAIDGISLTVANAQKSEFSVSIIPHTKDETTLLSKKTGDYVNLEFDIIAKYTENILNFQSNNNKQSNIDLNFLGENGFI